MICSIFFGLILALLRSYDKFVLGKLAGVYIEIFRNTPNLMWVLICYVYAPMPTAFLRCSFAFVLFTSATIAEIIRGGLNSIPRGQFEAAASHGLQLRADARVHHSARSASRTSFPPCSVRSSPWSRIPRSFPWWPWPNSCSAPATPSPCCRATPGQTVGIAQVAVIFGFAALIYFVINFTLSLRGFVTCISADTPPRGTWEKPPDPQKKFSATFPS